MPTNNSRQFIFKYIPRHFELIELKDDTPVNFHRFYRVPDILKTLLNYDNPKSIYSIRIEKDE